MAQQFGCEGRGAETVVYIEDGQAGHAGAEHAVEGGHAARADDADAKERIVQMITRGLLNESVL